MAHVAAPLLAGVKKKTMDGFGSLKTTLEAISVVYTNYEVRLQPLLVAL